MYSIGLHMPLRNFYCCELNYRPHPKDGEGTVFTGVCLSTSGWEVPQSRVLSQVLCWGGGYSSRDQRGIPPSQVRLGSRPGQHRTLVPPLPGQDGLPPPPTGKEQQSKYLLHLGWCASCVHAGELSCCNDIF